MPLDGIAHRCQKFFPDPWLHHEAVNLSLVNGLDDRVEAKHGGDEDAGGVGLELLGLGQKIQAGHPRHLIVGDDDRERLRLENLETLLGG